MGTATLTTTAVTAGKDSATGLYRLDPPFAGDDGALHEYGAAMVAPYSGFVDVFAADSDGHIVLDSDGDGCRSSTAPRWTGGGLRSVVGRMARRLSSPSSRRRATPSCNSAQLAPGRNES